MSRTSHAFTVNQVDYRSESDTYLNIQKRREHVRFESSSDAVNVNVSFVQSEEVSSSTNLTISDRSSSLPQNRFFVEPADQILEDVNGFTIETDLFLVTDVFTIDLSTQAPEPLFYGHELQAALPASGLYADVRIVDKDFNDVLSSSYVVESGLVYSNYLNTFDPVTGVYDIYYVTYVVRNTSGVLERYTEILNGTPAFHAAEFEDIDPDTGFIYPGIKAYLIEEDIGDTFNVTLPAGADYAVRRTSNTRIEILPPPTSGPSSPWFVRVKNGKFLSTGVNGIHKYYISEFGDQNFSPYPPFKATDEESYRVTSKIIKTLQDKITVSDADLLYPEVIVSKADGTFKFAVTADPDKLGLAALEAGTAYANVLLGDSKVAGVGIDSASNAINSSSIDSEGGFIVLPAGFEIAETDTIRTIYHYEEQDYQVTAFDFNPLHAAELLDKRVALFIRPEPLGSTLTKTLYYLLVDENGLVVDHDIDFTLNGASTASGILWYDRNPSGINWSLPSGQDFVNSCTVEGDANQDDILILGDVFTREALRPNSLITHDVRIRGGGVNESELPDAIEINPQTEWFWDTGIWDGKPFPGAAAIHIEVPIEVLDVAGGELSADNIQELVQRHMALGVYPVTHAYNIYQPTITGIDYLANGDVTLYWTPPISEDHIFDLLGADSADSGYTLVASGLVTNTTTLSEAALYNTYVVLGRKNDAVVDYVDGSIFDVVAVDVPPFEE
jgi:hypothetical protein